MSDKKNRWRLSETQRDCTGPSSLVPSALIGYRAWNCLPYNKRAESPIGLYALTGPPWSVETTAACLRGESVCDCETCYNIHRTPTHPAPNADCTCGIYGYYTPEFVDGMPWGFGFLGVIEASGRTLVGTKGFRTERARVVAAAPWIHTSYMYWWMQGQTEQRNTMVKAQWQMEEAGIHILPSPERLWAKYPPPDYQAMLDNLAEGTAND